MRGLLTSRSLTEASVDTPDRVPDLKSHRTSGPEEVALDFNVDLMRMTFHSRLTKHISQKEKTQEKLCGSESCEHRSHVFTNKRWYFMTPTINRQAETSHFTRARRLQRPRKMYSI